MARKQIYFTQEAKRIAANRQRRENRAKRDPNPKVVCDCRGFYRYSKLLNDEKSKQAEHEATKRHIQFVNDEHIKQKCCKRCKETKLIEHFYTAGDSHQSRCIPCHNIFRNESR